MQGSRSVPCEQILTSESVLTGVDLAPRRVESQEFRVAVTRPCSSRVAGTRAGNSKRLDHQCCALFTGERLRGEQAPQFRDELCQRLSSADTCIDRWRQAVALTAAQQDDRDIRTNRLQASRHVRSGRFRLSMIEHDSSNWVQEEKQRDGLQCTIGADNLIASGPECCECRIALPP